MLVSYSFRFEFGDDLQVISLEVSFKCEMKGAPVRGHVVIFWFDFDLFGCEESLWPRGRF